jgi:hypothetical protein
LRENYSEQTTMKFFIHHNNCKINTKDRYSGKVKIYQS